MRAAPLVIQLVSFALIAFGLAGALSLRAQAVDANQVSPQAQQKRASEPETRAVMDAIRRRVINVHTLITHRRMPPAAAAQFARDTNSDVERIIDVRAPVGCARPDPIAPIVQKIRNGAAAIAQPTPERGQVDGLVDVVSALEEYGTSFDHPGWQRLQQQ